MGPFFGSCWGHQLLGKLAGGRVVTDRERAEVGTFEITVTDEGKRDPLLTGYPEAFAVQLGHNDHVEEPPADLRVLASPGRGRCQIIRWGERPAYGSQFHSEMGQQEMRDRARVYQDRYLGASEEAFEAFASQLRPSPAADGLLDRFLSLYAD